MKQIGLLGLVTGVLALAELGCTQQPITLPLRSLERSGEVSFICVDTDGNGHDINSCPDFDSATNPRHLQALVTQTLRGEIAVVDLSTGSVVDMDHSTPGFNFLPVGANPVDIVSTPGGVASFVGVAEVGKEGLYGIPTSCVRPPLRDLTDWPACALPAAPGEMALTIDPAAPDDDGNPDTPAPVRATCDSAPSAEAATPGTALAATRADCPADLALEKTPAGRRKLLVTLPSLGAVAVIDAQGVLDREPGSYKPCDIERFLPLDLKAPAATQKVPADLQSSCVPQEIDYGPSNTFTSQPGGIDLADDGRLFVSDRGAPVVHVLDMSDPCAPVVQPSLLPKAFEARNKDIFTSQVAVSPATSTGQRFAYAVDDTDGSVMIFDVTPGHADRTPIIRPGSPWLPFEAPDRISYSSPARDVAFVLRDAPVADPTTGVATIGTYCDPNPDLPATSPAAQYRPSLDYSKGAAPRNLRGVFGLVMLASGQVAVVDVEDFDAKCRRPIYANSSATQDYRGCADDPKTPPFYTLDQTEAGKRTVSGELSCRTVEQHRSRSGHLMINSSDVGINAPALRNVPRLRAADGSSLPTDQSDEGKNNPKLLAVDFPNPNGGAPLPVQVYIGTSVYESPSATDANPNRIDVDPKLATQGSLALVLNEPRAFGGDDDMTLQFEGAFVAERKTGFPTFAAAGDQSSVNDGDGNFCNRGVEDVALARDRGVKLGVAAADLDKFAQSHADYLQITQELADKDSGYWHSGVAATCGGSAPGTAYFTCYQEFGTRVTPAASRDFRILEAYQNKLVIEPRTYADAEQRQRLIDLAYCCFGTGAALTYKVRASEEWVLTGVNAGFRHDVIADSGDNLRCIRDCNPQRKLLNSRAVEVSAKDCKGGGLCDIGPATEDDVACVLSKTGPLAVDSACVFQNLTHRFAIYRGNSPSVRDTAFGWTVSGGFAPLTANLLSQGSAVSPQSMSFIPQIGQLAVVDGASEGLVLVSLDTVSVSHLFF